MYKQEFENLLKNGKKPRALLLYGDNNYLIESYIQYYINQTNTADLLMKVYFDEYNFDMVKGYLSQGSLFGGTNLLIIKRDKKIPKKELDILIDLVYRNMDNYLIFHFQGQSRDVKSLQSSFNPKKGAIWVRLFEPTFKESIEILQKKAKYIGLDIDYYALQHLVMLLNNNLMLSAKELEKLAILDRKVTSKDIDNLVYSTAPLAIEQLLIDLFEKRAIVETLSRLLELGEDEFSILRATQFFISQIFLFNSYMKLNGRIDSRDILGYKLPKHIENQKANLALRVKSDSILKIFEHLLKVELEMKETSPINRETLLYGALIRLQGYL
jgi:DNA polymerase-3 subunit delta